MTDQSHLDRKGRKLMTADDPRGYAGYRAHTRARSTGTLVVLVDGYAQGLTYIGDHARGGDGRWFLICDDHGGILSDPVQSVLRPFMSAPEQWCPDCQEVGK